MTKIKPEYIFPLLLILLDVGAAVIYAVQKDYKKGCLLVSSGCVECDSDVLGGYMDSAKEQKAIERLKTFEPADGYYLAYSGGKDSDCIKILAQLAGVKFEAVHNLTTVDAPETVRYVQSQPDVKIDKAG